MMTSVAYRERRQLAPLPFTNGLRVRRHHPTPPRVLRYRAGGLRKKRRAFLCPLSEYSLLPIVRCTLRRAERGNAARSRLYFVGYVTSMPHPSTPIVGPPASTAPSWAAASTPNASPLTTHTPRSESADPRALAVSIPVAEAFRDPTSATETVSGTLPFTNTAGGGSGMLLSGPG